MIHDFSILDGYCIPEDTLEIQTPVETHAVLTEMAQREGKSVEKLVSEIISGEMRKLRCVCDNKALVSQGCTCGAFQAEQELFKECQSMPL